MNRRYLLIEWMNQFNEYPKKIYSEIDEEDYEIRKIEIFEDGTCRLSSYNSPTEEYLSDQTIPNIDEINKNEQLTAISIEREEFEHYWKLYNSQVDM